MNKTTSLITGGAGFIGSYISEKLIELGHGVIIIDNLNTGHAKNIPKQAKFIRLDIGQEIALEKLKQLFREHSIDYVFHCASIPRTHYSVEHPVECNNANVNGTLHVLEAARMCGVNIKKIIHSSSCGIYGKQDIMPIAENALIKMGTPYSVQKYMQELYMKMYSEIYNIPIVMLRYFNVYGTRRQSEEGSYPNVLAAFSKQKRENNILQITGDGTQTRDMVHVNDVVDANILAMKSEFKTCEAFNIGTGYYLSMNEVAKYFNCPVRYIPARVGEAKCLVSDSSKAKEHLKWIPKIQFEEGIQKYFNS